MTRPADRPQQQTRDREPSLATTTERAEPDVVSDGRRTRTYLVVLLVIYLVLLVWIVLWKLEPPWIGRYRVLKLVPFVATRDAGASPAFDVITNVVLFIPFGLYLGLLAPLRPWWRTAGIFAGASSVLEGMQYVLAVGSSDITDVIVNTVGGLTGLAIVALGRKKIHGRTFRALNLVCGMGTALSLLATGLFLVSSQHIVHPRDIAPLEGTHQTRSR